MTHKTPNTQKLHLVQAGAHRGGKQLQQQLLASPVLARVGGVEVIDPQPGRAEHLARGYQDHHLVAQGRQARVQDALTLFDPDAVALLAIDDLGAMQGALRGARGSVIAQVLGRGSASEGVPAAAFALSCYSFPDRPEERAKASDLLGLLADIAPPQSSIAVREDPFNARRAATLREHTSRRSIEVLADLDRVHDQDILSELTWSRRRYPLVAVERERGLRQLDQAVDVAGSAALLAVAVIDRSSRRVEFFVFERLGHRTILRLHVPLQGSMRERQERPKRRRQPSTPRLPRVVPVQALPLVAPAVYVPTSPVPTATWVSPYQRPAFTD